MMRAWSYMSYVVICLLAFALGHAMAAREWRRKCGVEPVYRLYEDRDDMMVLLEYVQVTSVLIGDVDFLWRGSDVHGHERYYDRYVELKGLIRDFGCDYCHYKEAFGSDPSVECVE